MSKPIMITDPILRGLLSFTEEIPKHLEAPDEQIKTSTGDWFKQMDYNRDCKVFNLRFHEKPWVIVYCRNESEIQATYACAIANNLPVRIRAGGHDHEAECTGTNTILIDVSNVNSVRVDDGDSNSRIAHIGPGNIFKNLTTALAKEEVMIAHGTCATVGIAGFVMGGGWGPWTRKHGMCCERLVGANLVLGDGTTTTVKADGNEVPDLLWALRGGGGMSYGLVTEFSIKTFDLPKTLIRFKLTWNPYEHELDNDPKECEDYVNEPNDNTGTPTLSLLKAWEEVICSSNTSKLIGTNLKISGKPESSGPFNKDTIEHNSAMFGYWEGEKDELKLFVKEWFATVPNYSLCINPKHGGTGSSNAYGETLMSDWARESHNKMLMVRNRKGENLTLNADHHQLLADGKPLPPDYDDPAPHKITSRLANNEGLQDEGHEALLRSLTSPLILERNRELGLFSYVTLGAIVGDYYRSNPEGADSAFPYKDKLYTIQYQTWWNLETAQQIQGQNSEVNDRTNRALDWMEVARDYEIPNTSGSFISFKDSSIPTKTYFAESYDRLKEIKKNYSEDHLNHFRTRKTII